MDNRTLKILIVLLALGVIGEGISQKPPKITYPFCDPKPLPDEPIRIENGFERIWVYNNRTANDAWRDIGPWLIDTTVFMVKLDRLTNKTWAAIIYVQKKERAALPDSLLRIILKNDL